MNELAIQRLKKLRASKGLSQSQLAKASGVGVRILQDYEQGRRDIDGGAAMSILKLAQVLDTTVEYLLLGDSCKID